MTEPMPQPEFGDRRTFLRVLIFGGIALGAAGVGLIAAAPRPQDGPDAALLPMLPVADLAKLQKGKPLGAELSLSRRDGWRVRTLRQRVYILRVADGDTAAAFKVFSAVCPHAGCEVELKETQYVCPCHQAKFDTQGEKVSGPAPRGLDPLEVEVSALQGAPWLKVRWQDFVVGIEERVARKA